MDPADPLVTVDVQLRASDPAVDILDYRPRRITVRLDPVVTRTVPVQVDYPTVPEGLEPSAAELSQQSVDGAGPESVVSQVVAAEARVPDPAVRDRRRPARRPDRRGRPGRAAHPCGDRALGRSRADRGEQRHHHQDRAGLAGHHRPAGTRIPLDSTTAQPSVVTLSGNADVLATLLTAPTVPISIDGATEDLDAGGRPRPAGGRHGGRGAGGERDRHVPRARSDTQPLGRCRARRRRARPDVHRRRRRRHRHDRRHRTGARGGGPRFLHSDIGRHGPGRGTARRARSGGAAGRRPAGLGQPGHGGRVRRAARDAAAHAHADAHPDPVADADDIADLQPADVGRVALARAVGRPRGQRAGPEREPSP